MGMIGLAGLILLQNILIPTPTHRMLAVQRDGEMNVGKLMRQIKPFLLPQIILIFQKQIFGVVLKLFLRIYQILQMVMIKIALFLLMKVG